MPKSIRFFSKLGAALYRLRAVIGTSAFIPLWLFGKPLPAGLLWSLGTILPGLALRLWAAGYIGAAGRSKGLEIQRIVADGPYRYFRHPLYLGNFLLVLGVLILFRPPAVLMLVIVLGFVAQYSIIARAEEQMIREEQHRPSGKVFFCWARLKNELWTVVIVAVIYLLTVARMLFSRG